MAFHVLLAMASSNPSNTIAQMQMAEEEFYRSNINRQQIHLNLEDPHFEIPESNMNVICRGGPGGHGFSVLTEFRF